MYGCSLVWLNWEKTLLACQKSRRVIPQHRPDSRLSKSTKIDYIRVYVSAVFRNFFKGGGKIKVSRNKGGKPSWM